MAAEERSMSCLWGLFLQQCRNVFGRIYRKNPDLENVAIITYFTKIGLPRAAIYHVPMHRDKKNRRKKSRKQTTGSTDARKEEEPASQDHLGQEGSHLNETG